jgi:Rrf2 family transcriptional regulator, nitric oxide-sensitive transcriptional repressor
VLSQTAEYGLRAVLMIAKEDGRPVGAARLAGQLRIPPNYLSKTLHQLARAGILRSSRGRLGGFRLAKPPDRTLLIDVVSPFGELQARQSCLLGRPVCSDSTACAAHQSWKRVAEMVADFFRETSVADLLKEGGTA